MSEKIQFNLELDIDQLKQEMIQRATYLVLDNYFEARDIEKYDDRDAVKRKRIKAIIDKVDWNKLPEEMQRSILSEFIKKFIKDRY